MEPASMSIFDQNYSEQKDSTHLANTDPQLRLLDICGRLVVATQESHRWCCICSLGSLMQVGENGVDVRRVGNICWV